LSAANQRGLNADKSILLASDNRISKFLKKYGPGMLDRGKSIANEIGVLHLVGSNLF
jgi:hypothetical protein